MGKKDKEHSKEKRKKKHKHHKSSKNKTLDSGGRTSKNSSMNLEDDIDIDVEEEQRSLDETPNSLNQSKDSQDETMNSFNQSKEDEENIDVEAEEEQQQQELELNMEEDVREEEVIEEEYREKEVREQTPLSTIIHIEKPSSLKKLQRKLGNITPGLEQFTFNPKKGKKRRESGTSSEEERWLTAVESGKLEEIEDVELRKMKDPKLMTARQRAMYDRNNDTESAPGFSEALIALPTGYKEKEKPQTAEELQKAALKIIRRKQQADEKREKDKKKTMERLLKKQESKHRSGNKPKSAKTTLPMISYRNTLEGAYIQLPPGIEFPLEQQKPKEPPPQQLCGIVGCGQPKVYNYSKTNLPLCSFACYRKNVQSLKEIIC